MATTAGFGVLLVLVFLAFGAVKVHHIRLFVPAYRTFPYLGLALVPIINVSLGALLLQVMSKVRGWKESWDAVRAPKQDNNLYYGLYYR